MRLEDVGIIITSLTPVGASLGTAVAWARIAKGRGYTSPAIQSGIVLGGMLAAGTAWGLAWYVAINFVGVPGASTLTLAQYTFILLFGATTNAALLVAPKPLLPPRDARVAGVRIVRFPWLAAGVACVLILIVSALVSLVTWNISPFGRLVVTAPLAGLCFYYARRAKAETLDEILARDSRWPVLYIRAFIRESEIFTTVERPPGLKAALADVFADRRRLASGVEVSTRIHTFESYFSDAIITTMGPLVALGNPTDYVMPEGAVRAYVADRNWTAEFAALAQRATCIIAGASRTENVLWEFAYLREHDLQCRLIFITPPDLDLEQARPHGAWRELPATLERVGLLLSPHHIVRGAAIGFDDSGRSLLLVRDAAAPAAYVNAIAHHLSRERRLVVV
jgi:hypothetical protein